MGKMGGFIFCSIVNEINPSPLLSCGEVGEQSSHNNVRSIGNPRAGSVDGVGDHYCFNCRNRK